MVPITSAPWLSLLILLLYCDFKVYLMFLLSQHQLLLIHWDTFLSLYLRKLIGCVNFKAYKALWLLNAARWYMLVLPLSYKWCGYFNASFQLLPLLLLLLLVCESLYLGKCILGIMTVFQLDHLFFCFPNEVVLLRNCVILGNGDHEQSHSASGL